MNEIFEKPLRHCPECNHRMSVQLPWCPECGAQCDEHCGKNDAFEPNSPISERTDSFSGGSDWVMVFQCDRPVGATALALMKHLGIEIRVEGHSAFREAGKKLYPIIFTRREDADRARMELEKIGLI